MYPLTLFFLLQNLLLYHLIVFQHYQHYHQKVIDGVKDNAEKLREKVRGIEEALAALQ